MNNDSFWYKVKYLDKNDQPQDVVVMAKDTKMAIEKVKSENEVKEIKSSIKLPSADSWKSAMNKPNKN